MARNRDWPTALWAEVFIRFVELGQSPSRVAKATGLTYMQVRHFAGQASGSDLPPNQKMPTAEELDEVRIRVEAACAEEDRIKPPTAKTIDEAALDEEIVGCIDLVRKAAAQFGISPRNFLHRCITHRASL